MFVTFLFVAISRIEFNGLLYEVVNDSTNVSLIGTYDNWKTLIEQKGKLEIPSTVVNPSAETTYLVYSINIAAFENCSHLVSLVMPDSIVIIDEKAFKDCFCLSSILFSKRLLEIRSNAFDGCKSLLEIRIESALKVLGRSFKDCDSLTRIDISKTELEDVYFNSLVSLETIILPSSVQIVCSYCFGNCYKLVSINLENVKRIKDYAFYGCRNLKKVNFSSDLENIGESAFSNCHSLEIADFSATKLNSISSECFKNCYSLTTALFPDTTKYIGENGFEECKSLKRIIYYQRI